MYFITAGQGIFNRAIRLSTANSEFLWHPIIFFSPLTIIERLCGRQLSGNYCLSGL